MSELKFADWTLPEIAYENNKLNDSYFKTGEYNEKPEYYKLKEAMEYILSLEIDRPMTVLDVGSGSGWHALYFEKCNIGKEISFNGVDISPSMCENAKNNCPSGNFFIANIEDGPVGDFDIVFESGVLPLIPNWKLGLQNSLRSSKKWFITHRIFFTDEKTVAEQSKTYLNIPDVRYHIGMEDLIEIANAEGFSIVKKDIWVTNPYKMGTFILRRN